MSDVSESELISAYLDGELTAEEQVRAEQILASSAEARQLLEELRALGGTLQSLPQEKLDEDLGPRVLQVAERRMLSPPEESKKAEPKKSDGSDEPSAGRAAAALTSRGDDATASEGFPWRELSWRGMFSPRALIWSAIVVAVAIIIRFNAPPQNVNRELAGLDKDKPGAAVADKDEKRKKSNVEPSWRAPADAPKAPAPTEFAKSNEKKDDRHGAVAKSVFAGGADKAAESTRDREQLAAGKDGRREFSMKGMPSARAREEALPERIAKDSPAVDSKAGPAAPGTPLLSEMPAPAKPASQPAMASGQKLAAGNIAAQGGAVELESQNRVMQREGVHSKATDGQISGEGVVAGKDAAELGRGEGGGRGGRLANEKKLDQAKVIAANAPSPPAPEAPSPVAAPPVAAPSAASAPMAAPALTVPTFAGQKAGASDVVAAKIGGGQAVPVVPVINLNCSVAAASNGAFDKLLSENGIATTTSLGNYSQQSIARYQNFRADNGSLSPGGVQMPLGGTASLGSTGRQQQAAQQQVLQQQSPNYNQARREVAENSASRGSSAAPNSEPAAIVVQSRGTATNDNSLNNSLSGSNSYGANSSGTNPKGQNLNGTGALGGGTQAAMADNTANAINTAQQAGVANPNNYYQQGPAKSGSVSNLGGALGTSPPTITYEIDTSPAQLAGLIKQIRQDREAFSSPDVPPALEQELQKAGRRLGVGGGFGGRGHQLKDQAGNGARQVQAAPAEGAQLQNARAKPGPADAEADWAYKLREQNLQPQAGAVPAGTAQSQPAPPAQQPPAAGKTHVVFVLNVVDRVLPLPAAAQPAPAAPAKGK